MSKITDQNKTLHHLWSILCEKSSIDQTSNLLSIFNVIEEITLSDLKRNNLPIGVADLKEDAPFAIDREVHFINTWRRNVLAEENNINQDIKIEWLSPAGNVLMMKESIIKVETESKNIRVISVFDKLIVTTVGAYILKLSAKQNGETAFHGVVEIPVDIKVL